MLFLHLRFLSLVSGWKRRGLQSRMMNCTQPCEMPAFPMESSCPALQDEAQRWQEVLIGACRMPATECYPSCADADTFFVLSCLEGQGWLLSATCVPWYVSRLSKHRNPCISELLLNVAHVWTKQGGYSR